MNLPRLLLGLLPSVFFLSCTASQAPNRPTALPDTGPPALHALDDAKLRHLMDQMNALMFDRFSTQPDLDKERQRYAARMAVTAAQLGTTVDAILARLPELNLDEVNQVTFRALAGRLRDQTATLEAQSRRNQIDAIGETLDQMSITCTSCHQLFRRLKH